MTVRSVAIMNRTGNYSVDDFVVEIALSKRVEAVY